MSDLDLTNINEAGASENSLSPGGGTAGGDIKTKTIADIVAALGTKSNEDLNGFLASLAQIGHEADNVNGNAANMTSIKSGSALKPVVKEDLQKIFAKEESLSENFIDQATTLFEAAIEARLAVEVENLEETFETRLASATEAQLVQFTERLDSYLDYVAERYLEENQVAIENGIRLELAESLFSGLATLVREHNVHIDEEKVDVVAKLEEQVNQLHTKLNEQINLTIAAETKLEEREIANVVNNVTEGMVEADRDRFLVMAEAITYENAEDFEKKLASVKDTFFKEGVSASNDNNGLVLEADAVVSEEDATTPPVVEAAPATSQMDRYVQALSADVKKLR